MNWIIFYNTLLIQNLSIPYLICVKKKIKDKKKILLLQFYIILFVNNQKMKSYFTINFKRFQIYLSYLYNILYYKWDTFIKKLWASSVREADVLFLKSS